MAPAASLLLLLAAAERARATFPFAVNMFAGTEDDCLDVVNILSSCEAAIPTFAAASTEEIAGCLCCDGSSWDAGTFDDPVESCYDYLTDELPAETSMISVIGGVAGYCSLVGSVDCGGSGATATTTDDSATTTGPTLTASTAIPTGSAGCESAIEIVQYCSSSVIPDWDAATDEDLAGCVCYDGSTWVPDMFDGYMSGCLAWASTDDPDYYSSISALDDFCSSEGDVGSFSAEATTTRISTDDGSTTTEGGLAGIPTVTPSSTRTIIVTPTSSDAAIPVVGSPANGITVSFLTWLLGFYIML